VGATRRPGRVPGWRAWLRRVIRPTSVVEGPDDAAPPAAPSSVTDAASDAVAPASLDQLLRQASDRRAVSADEEG
jgi:hypothetical protein